MTHFREAGDEKTATHFREAGDAKTRLLPVLQQPRLEASKENFTNGHFVATNLLRLQLWGCGSERRWCRCSFYQAGRSG